MENKTVVIVAFIIGAILVFFLVRGGSSSDQVRSLAPLPPGDSGDRAQAFSDLLNFYSEQARTEAEQDIARVQAGVELQRINVAYQASVDQARAQLEAMRTQAGAQNQDNILGFLNSIGTALIGAFV